MRTRSARVPARPHVTCHDHIPAHAYLGPRGETFATRGVALCAAQIGARFGGDLTLCLKAMPCGRFLLVSQMGAH